MQRTILILIAFILFYNSNLLANEVDNFSRRYEPLNDVTQKLNLELNRRIELAVLKTNLELKSNCNEDRLYKNVKEQLAQIFYSKFELYIIFNDSYDKLFAPKKSVYHYFSLFSSDPSGADLSFALSPLFKVNGVLVGGDKFSHFFTEGWKYFQKKNFDKKGLEAALNYGELLEKTLLGLIPSGVYSYADLMANYQGLIFWERLINSSKIIDPIIKNNKPYVECKENRWVQVGKADFSDYINEGFDEGINCSKFRDNYLETLFKKRIFELNNETKKNMECPISKNSCKQLSIRFGTLSNHLIHPSCRIFSASR